MAQATVLGTRIICSVRLIDIGLSQAAEPRKVGKDCGKHTARLQDGHVCLYTCLYTCTYTSVHMSAYISLHVSTCWPSFGGKRNVIPLDVAWGLLHYEHTCVYTRVPRALPPKLSGVIGLLCSSSWLSAVDWLIQCVCAGLGTCQACTLAHWFSGRVMSPPEKRSRWLGLMLVLVVLFLR